MDDTRGRSAVTILVAVAASFAISAGAAARGDLRGGEGPGVKRVESDRADSESLGRTDGRVRSSTLAMSGGGCPTDIDGNGVVGFTDLITVIMSWGPCGGCAADVTGDGIVSTIDLVMVLSTWGPCG